VIRLGILRLISPTLRQSTKSVHYSAILADFYRLLPRTRRVIRAGANFTAVLFPFLARPFYLRRATRAFSLTSDFLSDEDSYQWASSLGNSVAVSRSVVRPCPRRIHTIRLHRDTRRRVFPSSLPGWPSFVDGLRRSTETVARKRAGATRRTPTTVTSYTTDFISLCCVPRRDVGCRKPTISLHFTFSPLSSLSFSFSLPLSLPLSAISPPVLLLSSHSLARLYHPR